MDLVELSFNVWIYDKSKKTHARMPQIDPFHLNITSLEDFDDIIIYASMLVNECNY